MRSTGGLTKPLSSDLKEKSKRFGGRAVAAGTVISKTTLEGVPLVSFGTHLFLVRTAALEDDFAEAGAPPA